MKQVWIGLLLVVGFGSLARSAPAVRLRVLTYNIHHGEGTDGRFDLARLAAVIRGAEPDLVALQEVDRGTLRSGGVDQLAELEHFTGMRGAFGKAMDFQGGAYGVGVLTRQDVLAADVHRLPGAPDREPRAALAVDVRVGAGEPLRFISTHLDQGRDSDSRAAQARFLAEQLGAADDRPAILAGDFNGTPDAPILSVIRTTWTELFMQPMPAGPEGLPRRRVDHVLGRPASGWLTLDSGFIEDRVASDHRPVFVTIEWTGR